MNKSNAEGVFDQAKGKVKEAVGEAFNNQKLANEGAADQVKGHAKEAWGNVKDTAAHVTSTNTADAPAHDDTNGTGVRKTATNAAANIKDSINRGLDNLEHKHANR